MVEDLEIHLKGRALVRGLSFQVGRSECVGLLGDSGTGKSTVANAVLGILPGPFHWVAGEIRFRGVRLRSLASQERHLLRGSRIGMAFQESLLALDPLQSVEDQLDEVMRRHRSLEKSSRRSACLDLLAQMRLPDPEWTLGAYPHELSGGMRQRVVLALALAGKPDLLICDEPTAALDTVTRLEIMSLLEKLKVRTNLSILLISHDLDLIHSLSDRVVSLHGESRVEEEETSLRE